MGPVAHQPACGDVFSPSINRRNLLARDQGNELIPLANEKRTTADKQRADSLTSDGCKSRIELAIAAYIQEKKLQPHRRGGIRKGFRSSLSLGDKRIVKDRDEGNLGNKLMRQFESFRVHRARE